MREASAVQIVLVGAAQVAAMTLWFSATAVLPSLEQAWDLSRTEAAWLTGAVQIGFALGALGSGVLQLADRFDARWLFAVCAAGGAACNVVLALDGRAVGVDVGPGLAIALRFVTGVLLAGVYPPGMKLAASHAPPSRRGLAIGSLVGCLTLGSALPHLIRALAGGGGDQGSVSSAPWRTVLLVAAAAALAAAVLVVTAVRVGPYAGRAAPFTWRRVSGVLSDPVLRRLHTAYAGHMWELYALWTWVAVWLTRIGRETSGTTLFAAIGVGGAAGAVAAGSLADRWGRRPVARAAMAVSAGCCLASPALPAWPVAAVVAFLVVWGASVIADSAQFSAATTEACAPDAMGTALTLQTFLGFGITLVTIHGLPWIADAVGWRYAMTLLAVGPLLGILVWRAPPRASP